MANTTVHQLSKLNVGILANHCLTAVLPSVMKSRYRYALKTLQFISALIKAPGLILDFTKLCYNCAQTCRQFNNSLESYLLLPLKTRSHPFRLLRSRNSRTLNQSVHKRQMKSVVTRAVFQRERTGSCEAVPLALKSQGPAARAVCTTHTLPQRSGAGGRLWGALPPFDTSLLAPVCSRSRTESRLRWRQRGPLEESACNL